MPLSSELFASSQVQIILVLVGVDVILGILGALMRKDFRLSRLADFMKKMVVGYVLGFAVVLMAAAGQPSLSFLVPVAFILVVVALAGSILRNLGKLGLPLPGSNMV